jgi:histidinol dehydrogenase
LEVEQNIGRLAEAAPRAEKVIDSLSKYGFIITCDNLEEAIKLTNQFAAEHLEVMTINSKEIAERLVAGLILVGPYTPVALSDYGSGTNHVLPTGGFAHVFSGLSCIDYMRRVSIAECSKAGLDKAKANIKILTETENLPNHYKAIEARFQK